MSKEALRLALEALEYIYEGANNQGPHTGISWRCVSKKAAPVITALRQALANEALDKMAENARELGLDYEPVWDNLPSNKDVEDAMRLKRLSQLAEQPAQQWCYCEPTECKGVGRCRWHAMNYSPPALKPAQRKPLTDEDQIAEALRRHGLTLVKTAKGYDVMNLGRITAHGIKGDA